MIEVNGIHIEPTRFPDGTQQVWKLPEETFNPDLESEIYWRFDSELEIITIFQLAMLLSLKNCRYINYTIPYLPYGRQDKEVSNDTCFALTTFMNLFVVHSHSHHVTVFDPHSTNLLNLYFGTKLKVKMPNVNQLAEGYDYVCFPDAGASKRYTCDKSVIVGVKVRDQQTGWITSYELNTQEDLRSKRVLVVDDICTGGNTFLLLGQKLQSLGAVSDLYVSHGDFKEGQKTVDSLLKYYSKIITTNSMTANSYDPYKGLEVLDWKTISI